MNTSPIQPEDAGATPPIVLLADADTARAEGHANYMESSGLWVAVQEQPGGVLDDVLDLRPDAVVAATHFGTLPAGRDVVHVLRSRPDTKEIPIVLLGESVLPVRTADHADDCLESRVASDVLVRSVLKLIHSRKLRERADGVRRVAGGLIERSSNLIARAHDIDAPLSAHARRSCPGCGKPLDWIERGCIDGQEYDYYHWCPNGCGLRCYNRSSHAWLKLAG